MTTEKITKCEWVWIVCAAIALLVTCHARGGETPPMDPAKPVYQSIIPGLWGIGGVYREVSPLSAEELKKEWQAQFRRDNRRKMWNSGFRFLVIGLVLAIGGMVMGSTLVQYGGQMVAHFATPVGITSAGTGIVLMRVAEWYWVAITGSAVLIVYGVVSYLLRNKGIKLPNVLVRRKKLSRPVGNLGEVILQNCRDTEATEGRDE